MVNEEQSVLCFPRACIAGCQRFTPWRTATRMIRPAEATMKWLPRWKAEVAVDWIQPIPCALVLGDGQGYHVFRRINQGRADLRRRLSLVVGGHIDWVTGNRDLQSLAMMTLMREIGEELGINPPSAATPIGLVVDPSSLEASRHIGIVYEVILAGRVKPRAIEEFSIHSKYSGRLCTLEELCTLRRDLDPWSRIIFGDYINPSYSLEIGQQLNLLPSE